MDGQYPVIGRAPRSGKELKQTFCMKRFREVVGNALVSGLIVVSPVYLCLLLLLKAAHSLGAS